MKTAKKVLSVVLAIAMALSCFAVAASAYGPDNATYQGKWWLTASTGDYAWGGTKLKPKVSANVDNCENIKNEIIVEAGDVVWIKMYTTTNYYPEAWAASLFFSKDLLSAADIYKAKWGAYPGASANMKDYEFVNENNYYILTSGGADVAFIAPTLYNALPEGEELNNKYYPTADNDPETKLLSPDDYKFDTYFWIHNAANADMNLKLQYDQQIHYDLFEEELTEEEWNDTYGWLMEVPFQVPANAANGTKYTVTLPELSMKREAKKDGILQFSICGDQTEEVTTKNAIMYSADQSFDFSEATIDIYVHEKPGGVTLDYTALEDAIADFEALTETDWTAASWADAKDAYDAAVALVDNAETQEEIGAAADALNDAITALVAAGPTLDFTELEAAIGNTPSDLSGYTTSTASAVDTAYDNAVAARSADNQEDIDAAAGALNNAIDALKLKVDTTELAAALAAAAAVEDKADWSDESVDDLDAAVAAGQALMTNADDTSVDAQGTFDDAADAINAILDHHMYDVANYTEVWALQDTVTGLKEADYTAASWAALEAALDAVVPGLLKSKQGQVDEMAAAIQDAIDGLKEIADTSRLERAVADAADAKEEDYAADVWTQIQNDVADADNYIGKGLASEDVQGDIDALTDDLNAALANMLTAADYADVNIAVNKMPDDFSLYTDESTQAVIEAYNAIDWTLKSDKQDQVNKMAADLEDAIAHLAYKPANLGALATALAKAQDVDPELVSADSYLALDLAMATAGNLMGSEIDIRDQADVDAAVAALNKAYDELEWLGADYSALNQAKADFEALDEDLYTVDSYAAAATAYDAATKVAANLGKADQDIIDNAATALSTAINELAFAACDYTALNAAKTAANLSNFYSGSTMPKYKDDLWTAYSEAKTAAEAIEAGLTKENGNQDKIDAAAAALADATAALKVDSAYASYDYTAVNAIVNEFNALNEDAYTPATWEAVKTLIEGLKMDYTMKAADYTKAQTQQKNLDKAYNALVLAGAADYTAVDAAIAAANKLNENEYTAESWKAVEDAIANVTEGLNENHQDEVDAMAAAIEQAINDLVEYVEPDADYTALDTAIAKAEKLDDTAYTADSWQNLVDAVIAGEGIARNLTAGDQQTIDDAAAAIEQAIKDLVEYVEPDADYTALNNAKLLAAQKDQSLYTAESWAALAAALAEAETVPADLKASYQKTIDDAAAAINAAIAGLTPKPPVEGGTVKDVKFVAPTKDTHNTFTITVEGRPSFLQFVELDHGNGTRSYDRYNANVSRVSYDAAGNVIDDRGDVAYEVWTIYTNLNEGETGVRAKYGKVWEDLGDAYNFNYAVDRSSSAVISAELAATSGKTGPVITTVVTGPDVEYIQLKSDDGATATYAASKAVVNADGTLTFTGKSWFNHEGACVVTVRVLAANKWTDATTLNYTASNGTTVVK